MHGTEIIKFIFILKSKSDILPFKHLLKGISNSFDSLFIVVSRIIRKHYCRCNFGPVVGLQLQAGVLWHVAALSDAIAEMKLLILCATDAGPGPGLTDRQADSHFLTRSKSIRPLARSERIIRRSCPPSARHFAILRLLTQLSVYVRVCTAAICLDI
jgi:hypothetical protein